MLNTQVEQHTAATFEKLLQRPRDYFKLPAEHQWEIDSARWACLTLSLTIATSAMRCVSGGRTILGDVNEPTRHRERRALAH